MMMKKKMMLMILSRTSSTWADKGARDGHLRIRLLLLLLLLLHRLFLEGLQHDYSSSNLSSANWVRGE
jgi:uncharacterized membrane protein